MSIISDDIISFIFLSYLFIFLYMITFFESLVILLLQKTKIINNLLKSDIWS